MVPRKEKKFYVITVDMGYGHQRAAFPFADLAQGGIINANNYPGITNKEKNLWQSQRGSYEFISYFKKIPFLGEAVFGAMDKLQDIEPFYPKRDLSASTLQQRFFFKKVKQGLGQELIKKLNKNPLPILSTFFVPVYFTEYYGYKGRVYCLICDADINRSWAPINPAKSSVVYLATTERAKKRLMMYGVKEEKIITTGFPLPHTNIGGENKPILKADLASRLSRLDPNGIFLKKHESIVDFELGRSVKPNRKPITLTFAVGGAGAQRELAEIFLPGLKKMIKQNQININLVAGSRPEVKDYFWQLTKKLGLGKNKNLKIIFHPDKQNYFKLFNSCLRTTDVLMTKPSELSFYAGLGLPLLMTEIVGAQERENRAWLQSIGAGLDALDLNHINEWLIDWLEEGVLARAAWQGYMEAENLATYTIPKIINNNL